MFHSAAVSAHFVEPKNKFQAESDGLSMDAMGPAHHCRAFVGQGLLFQDGQESVATF
jgi:hypothetical protein